MAGETVITVVGNLVEDPELRFTPSGAAVAAFRIASTPSRFNKDTSKWEDGDSLFLRCSVWRQAAENVAESLQRGMRVIVQGRLKQREWETKEGEKRTSYEIDVDEVGPSLKFATAKVMKTQRGGGGGGFGSGQQADNDPWASAAAAPGGQGNQGGNQGNQGGNQGNQGGNQGNQGGNQGNQGGNAGGWGASGSTANDEPPF